MGQKLLKYAIENQRWDVVAHALVLGMVIQKVNDGQKKRRPTRQSKRS